jgi:hypothetical protein
MKKRVLDSWLSGKKSGSVERRRSPIFASMRNANDQWPKNSHSRMITGIGTPNNQSRIPRPMISSINPLWIKERVSGRQVPLRSRRWSLKIARAAAIKIATNHGFGISESDSPILNSE